MNLKSNEEPDRPEDDKRFHTREEMEANQKLADTIPYSELPFNQYGEINNA